MILKLLERLGRKSILVDFYARVRMERWALFYYEDEERLRWWSWLPNVWIHHFPGPDTPDGENLHRHPASTVSVMLRGGYVENVNGRERVQRRFAVLSYKDAHRIVSVTPGSWSVFAHWFRRQPWTFDSAPCAAPCRACSELNKGVCFKEPKTLSYTEQFKLGAGAVRWERVDCGTARRLELRRRAIAKMGVAVPHTVEAGRYEMKKMVIRAAS